MGFDLLGVNPSGEKGKYFRNSNWWWHPLWCFVCSVCDDVLDEEDAKRGSYNDGHFLDVAKALRIAKTLKEMITNDTVKKYEQAYADHIRSLPDEVCNFCDGTGWREMPEDLVYSSIEHDDFLIDFEKRSKIKNAFHKNPDEHQTTKVFCNRCGGKGKARPLASMYPFSEENVRDFVEFCAQSGGFTIW